jgi:hypothetical protein
MTIGTTLGRRKIPSSRWLTVGLFVTVAALLWRDPFGKPPIPLATDQTLAWPEVENTPLTGPDRDPLPLGAVLRLGRERLRQRRGPTVLAFSPNRTVLASVEPLWSGRFSDKDKAIIHLWQLPAGKELRRLKFPPLHIVRHIQFSPPWHFLLMERHPRSLMSLTRRAVLPVLREAG